MGEYFSKLDTLEFDMGKFEDDVEVKEEKKEASKSSKIADSWNDWWSVK